MSGNSSRLEAIASINANGESYSDFDFAQEPSGDLFGVNVFNADVMKARLPKATFKSVEKVMSGEADLDASIADEVASAMKAWAMERGATHFAHVFYPLTGRMATKHDSFFQPTGTGVLSQLSGSALLQQEPDGSSFPNGGLRPTHEARAYTAWDITSPAYLLENSNGVTLCIPAFFVSWKGEALDMKTPLLRAQKAMGEQATRILKVFGHEDIAPVTGSGGPEQEYFLIDRAFYTARPDLIAAGRTLIGAASAKGQQFDDHYFGMIHPRVQAFMFDFERECYKLGIPVTTRHNEVAPGQYEVAPVYSSANVAADQQQLIMMLLQSIAEKHGFACLLHEKPFAGINGSGKHLNFSFGNSTQGNLLDPGDTPHDNAQFLVFCAAIIRSVHKYGHMLRASIAQASNDHRLGANEAPPAIMSVFLGAQLHDVFEQIKAGGADSSKESGTLSLGVDTLPPLERHSGDRNRTSPMAFTGNKFEFRAVGSYSSIAPALIMLNTVLAESFDYIASELEPAVSGGEEAVMSAVQEMLQGIMMEHGAAVFDGDGYGDAWHQEAEKRGLKNLRTSADALPSLGTEEAVELFGKYSVLSSAEVASREEVAIEQYTMTVDVEASTLVEMAKTMVYPAAVKYQGELAGAAANMKAAGLEPDMGPLTELTGKIKELTDGIAKLEGLMADTPEGAHAEATHCAAEILPQMLVIREASDALEGLVSDELWPLPTYQEMLFIR